MKKIIDSKGFEPHTCGLRVHDADLYNTVAYNMKSAKCINRLWRVITSNNLWLFECLNPLVIAAIYFDSIYHRFDRLSQKVSFINVNINLDSFVKETTGHKRVTTSCVYIVISHKCTQRVTIDHGHFNSSSDERNEIQEKCVFKKKNKDSLTFDSESTTTTTNKGKGWKK